MDLTLPIIGLLSASGYYFVKDGKVPRESQKIRETVVKNENPTGTNILTSTHSRETDNVYKEVMHDRFEKSKEFPTTNIFSHISDSTMNIDTFNDTKRENYKNVYNKMANDSEIFKPANYLNQLKEPENTLTGMPMEMEHTNMQPYFKGMMPKQNFKEYGSERRLELLTGVSNLYEEKQAVPNLFEPKQTKFPNLELVDRNAIQDSISKKKPFVDPYQKIDVTPIPGESMRPVYRTVDQMRKYDRLVSKGVNNTPSSRTKITASIGEGVKQPSRNITGIRFGAPKANVSVGGAKSGEYTRVIIPDSSDPYDNLFLNVPKFKHGDKVSNVLSSKYTHQPNNVDVRETEGLISAPRVKRRQRAPVNVIENLKLTERGDTVNDTYNYVPKKKRQGILHSNIEAKHTLKEGNLYQHASNPHGKRGGRLQATSHQGSQRSLRDTTGDNKDYYTTFPIGSSVYTNTTNHRVKELDDYSRLNLPDGKQRYGNETNGKTKFKNSIDNKDNIDYLRDTVQDIRKQTSDNPFFIKRY